MEPVYYTKQWSVTFILRESCVSLMADDQKIDRIYRNAVEVIPREDLDRRLRSSDPLRVKLGIDPTAPDIHLGFVVVLKKLREFQDLGYTAVLLVGDYTARVGDPSGRSKTRPVLSPEQIEANTRTYLEQAYLVLDRDRTEVRHNSEWLAGLSLADIIELTRATTVARILERDDFSKRFSAGDPVTMTELLYPLMQAYDSVALDADVELGGTDQLYNLLMGRHVIEYYGKEPQCVLTTPLLVGTFDTVARREVPEDVPEVELPGDGQIWIVDLITRARFADTNGGARRFIRGGAVRLDGEVVSDEKLSLPV